VDFNKTNGMGRHADRPRTGLVRPRANSNIATSRWLDFITSPVLRTNVSNPWNQKKHFENRVVPALLFEVNVEVKFAEFTLPQRDSSRAKAKVWTYRVLAYACRDQYSSRVIVTVSSA